MTDVRTAGYDEWLDAVAAGEGYFLACPNGHGSLPPRAVCPHCGSAELEEETLPDAGSVEAHTIVHVPTPRFDGEAPYVTAVADFGDVRLTGVVRGLAPADVEDGLAVVPTVVDREDGEGRLLVLEAR